MIKNKNKYEQSEIKNQKKALGEKCKILFIYPRYINE